MTVHSYAEIRESVESIAREEFARGGSWCGGLGRAEVEYGFEDLPDDSVTPLPVKLGVAIAACELRGLHRPVDLASEEAAIAELLPLVCAAALAAAFRAADLKAMALVLHSELGSSVFAQLAELLQTASEQHAPRQA